jgi:hypothetical protein
MNIHIEFIPASQMRYSTIGDWFERDGSLVIQVADMGNEQYNQLIALHELVEVMLCRHRGISQQAVDEFDMSHPEVIEPGDEPDAPYQNEHCFATAVERMVCAAMGIPWATYDTVVDATCPE